MTKDSNSQESKGNKGGLPQPDKKLTILASSRRPKINLQDAHVDRSQFFVDSTLENVRFSQVTDASPTNKEELEKLKQEMQALLNRVPAELKDEAEAVAHYIKEVAEQASQEQPNKSILKMSGDNLVKAAETLEKITPGVLRIAKAIVKFVIIPD